MKGNNERGLGVLSCCCCLPPGTRDGPCCVALLLPALLPLLSSRSPARSACLTALPRCTTLLQCVRMIEGAGSQWEDGPNHKLLVPSDGTGSMDVRVEWGSSATVTSTMASKRPGSEPMPKVCRGSGGGVKCGFGWCRWCVDVGGV